MTLAAGVAAGAVPALLSEVLLRAAAPRTVKDALRIFFTGLILRAIWTLGLLTAAAATAGTEAASFVFGLLGAFLAGQVFEGWRYRRQINVE